MPKVIGIWKSCDGSRKVKWLLFAEVLNISIKKSCTIIALTTDDIAEAYNLIKDLEPTTPQEYILKGVVNAALGQEQGSVSNI